MYSVFIYTLCNDLTCKQHGRNTEFSCVTLVSEWFNIQYVCIFAIAKMPGKMSQSRSPCIIFLLFSFHSTCFTESTFYFNLLSVHNIGHDHTCSYTLLDPRSQSDLLFLSTPLHFS